jgi:hypothetical protein
MAGHKPWSGIKTKMTPEMKLETEARAAALAEEILMRQASDGKSSPFEKIDCFDIPEIQDFSAFRRRNPKRTEKEQLPVPLTK